MPDRYVTSDDPWWVRAIAANLITTLTTIIVAGVLAWLGSAVLPRMDRSIANQQLLAEIGGINRELIMEQQVENLTNRRINALVALSVSHDPLLRDQLRSMVASMSRDEKILEKQQQQATRRALLVEERLR
jgi:hypothetical protein